MKPTMLEPSPRSETESCAPGAGDWAESRWVRVALWRLPLFVFLAGFFVVEPTLKTTVWSLSLAVMGGACLANAGRCGRLHCYFTGPFYLVASVVALLNGLGLLAIGWLPLGLAVLVGRMILKSFPERVWGKYAAR